jgi:hypothetical protein
MKPPIDFSFSQQNLQDYLDCPRRFELRYLQRLAWPAIRSEPVLELERQMRLGERFHQMVQQHQLGLPEETVASQATELELEEWWRSYLAHPPAELPSRRYPEMTLAAPFRGYRLVAKYDLVAVDPGRSAVIVDWKTNRKPIPPSILRLRAQTRLYPFLLALAGAHLNGGGEIRAEQIEMIYWFTADPIRPASFPYSQAQFEADREFLAGIIAQIEAQETPFPLTDDERRCLFCNYRSLCLRGVSAGREEESEADGEKGELLPDFDFDQIAEIQF